MKKVMEMFLDGEKMEDIIYTIRTYTDSYKSNRRVRTILIEPELEIIKIKRGVSWKR